MTDYSHIGERIKEARLQLGMTQEQLADMIDGVSRSMIANYESGRILNGPPVGILDQIAEACEVPINWLIRGDNNG